MFIDNSSFSSVSDLPTPIEGKWAYGFDVDSVLTLKLALIFIINGKKCRSISVFEIGLLFVYRADKNTSHIDPFVY